MDRDRWVPVGHELRDGSLVGRLVHAGPDWQIFRVDRARSLLIANLKLAERWVRDGLVTDAMLEDLAVGGDRYKAIESGPDHRLEPVGGRPSPQSKSDALSFAISLAESRKVDAESPLHDAIHVERFSRLLPTWSVSEALSDQEVLGRWLTGGVIMPATSLRRLCAILSWLEPSDVLKVVEAAGFGTKGVRANADRLQAEAAATEHRSVPVPDRETGSQEERDEGGKGDSPGFRLAGRPALEAFFNEHVVDIIRNADRYRTLGIEFPASFVLYGPPGCGKSFAIERLVEHLDWPIFLVESSTVGSPYIHETSRKVAGIFEDAMKASPSMIVIEEMESFLSDRTLGESAGTHRVEEVGEFLRRIPEAGRNKVLVVGTTNRIEMLDAAILRRGRFDHVIEVGMPSGEEVGELLESLLGKVPVEEGLELATVRDALTERALSDTGFVVREAARLAARSGKSAVDSESLRAALASLPVQEAEKRPIGFVHH